MSTARVAAVIAASLLFFTNAVAQPASFQGLGDLPGGSFQSKALGVSGDGNVVVGEATNSNGGVAFRWTAAGGVVSLGALPGGSGLSVARAASADGSVVVGASSGGSGTEAFRWTAAGGMQGLGDLPTGAFFSQGFGVSADGSVVAGFSAIAGAFGGNNEAFRWTSSGGMQGLGTLSGGDFSVGFGISADGSVVVGNSESVSSSSEAFRWTSGGGMVGLGFLPGGSSSSVYAASADGNAVVGSSLGAAGEEAFLWTPAGMTPLGMAGSNATTALAVSGDGTVVVGRIADFPLNRAFIWKASTGMENLREVLVQQGVDMTGWTLLEATGISANGRVIVGFGVNPQGQMEAWRAVLPRLALTDPAPGVLVVGGDWFQVRWDAPPTVGAVDLTLLPDTLGSSPVELGFLLAPTGTFAWNVTDTLFTRSARLVVTDSSDPTVADTSDFFRVRPRHLVRLSDNGRYDRYLPSRHGWQFANIQANMFPASWYAQFDYSNGVDPFTGLSYDFDIDDPPISAYPGAFPDWPAFVRAFGTDAAYTLITGLEAFYRPSFMTAWSNTFGSPNAATGTNFNGSCFGLSTASLLAFTHKEAFGARYPAIGIVDRIASVVLTGPVRAVNNELYSHQYGLVNVATTTASLSTTTPRTILARLKTDLLDDTDPSRYRNLTIYNVSACGPMSSGGAHTMTPYRLQRDPAASGRWRLHVYDSNRPADDATAFVVLDSTANTWSYANFTPAWGGLSCGIILEDRISNYLNLATPPLIAGPPTRWGGDSLRVSVRASSDVTLSAPGGGSAGYVDGIAFNTIEGALPLVPKVGGVAAPEAFWLPASSYTLVLSDHAGAQPAAWFRDGDLTYGFGRADADPEEADRLRYVPAGGLVAGGASGGGRAITLRALLAGEIERVMDAQQVALAGTDSVRLTAVDDPGGPRMRLTNHGGPSSYTLLLRQSGSGTQQLFRHVDVPLIGGATHTARPNWATLGTEPVEVDVDLDGDGIPDEVLVLENQPVANEPGRPPSGPPTRLALQAPTPNPAAGSTTLRFDLPAAGRARLAVYDALGRHVAVLVDGERPAGRHEVILEAGRLAPGVYVARLWAGGGVAAQRITVAR